MADDNPMWHSPLDSQFRAAHRALRALNPTGAAVDSENYELPYIVNDLEHLVHLARTTAATHVGPTFHWRGPRPSQLQWEPMILQIDFDNYSDDDPEGVSQIHEWENSAPAMAGSAYRRECGWDAPPGNAGIWLVSVMPYESMEEDQHRHWTGTLTGFVVLHDRDEDGNYEALAHLWTAREWRRRGVGSSLVREAHNRFPLSIVEGPVTDEGRLLLEVCAPDLLGRIA